MNVGQQSALDEFTIVIFGASGDLTRRKLMPALYAMYAQGFMNRSFRIVGYARRDWNQDEFCEKIRSDLLEFSRIKVRDDTLDRFCKHLYYHRGDLHNDSESYDRFRDLLQEEGMPQNRIFYLSVKPDLFSSVIRELHGRGLFYGRLDNHWSRVVIEKPFGRDLRGAVTLNAAIKQYLREEQIYRIDHYLGKETVQNVLSFRFANTLFEPVFNNHYVDHVQITAAETTGMESGRGAYYDVTGAVRDMVQNHLLQLLCLVAMEPPSSLEADAVHNEKVKVLRSIRRPDSNSIETMAVRGQYAGDKNGPGYREEDRIDPDSKTESYAAMRLEVDNWRWAGVPFYLRTGKRLQKRATEIVVQFKKPPLQLFQTVECDGDVCDLTKAKPNLLIFRIQPNEGISYRFSAKRPVMQMHVENVNMHFSYADTWARDLPEAYERLILDIIKGDSTLFTRSDETEAAWSVVDPIIKTWSEREDLPVYEYKQGSWGPDQADCIFTDRESAWHDPA